MSTFNPQTVTKAGEELIARALASKGTIQWTRVALGDGTPGGEATELEELVSPKLDAILINNEHLGRTAELIVKFSNESIEEEFDIKELGIFGRIEGDTESVLYSYTTATDCSTLPINSAPFEMEWAIYTQVTNGDKIDILINPTLQMLNKETADELYETKFLKNSAFNLIKATDKTSFSETELASMALLQEIITFLKEYSDANTAGLIDSAPITLDTLNELARALDDDPNFATTITNLISGKLSKGEVSVDYDNGGKIENKIKNLFSDVELWSGDVNVGPITFTEAYTNFNLLEINTSDGESKLIRTKALTSRGYIGIWGGTMELFDPAGNSRYCLDGYLRVTVTDTTTLAVSCTRTAENNNPTLTSIIGIGRK